jgi:transcription elongation factor Elf1
VNEVTWRCPKCNHENIDLQKETVTPMCGGCENHFHWEDIAHVSDDLDLYLNVIDAMSNHQYGKSACDLMDNHEDATDSMTDDFANSIKPKDALQRIALKSEF